MAEGRTSSGTEGGGKSAPAGHHHDFPWWQSKLWVGLLVPAIAALFTFSQWLVETVRVDHEHEVEHARYCQAQATEFIDRFTAAESLDAKRYVLTMLNALEQVEHHGARISSVHEHEDETGKKHQHGQCNHGPLLVAMARLTVDDTQSAAEAPTDANAVEETIELIQKRVGDVEVKKRRYVQIGATPTSTGPTGLVDWAKRLSSDEEGGWDVSVYETTNGSSAIAIGPLSEDEAKEIKKKWDSSKAKPKKADPALITQGKNYARRIHPPVAPRRPTTAQMAAQMAEIPPRLPERLVRPTRPGEHCLTQCEQVATSCDDRCATRSRTDPAFGAAACRRSCERTRGACEAQCR